MNYNEFLEEMASDLHRRMPGIDIQVHDVSKLQGQSYKGLSFRPEGSDVAATIDLQGYFSQLSAGRSYTEIMAEVGLEASNKMANMPTFNKVALGDYDQMKQTLCMEVVGIKGNREMLAQVPHETLQDMAVVYRFHVDEIPAFGSILVTNQMLEHMKVTPEQLKADAASIAPIEHPAKIQSMLSVLYGMDSDMDMPILPDDPMPLYVASTSEQTFGAGVLAYPGFMEQAREKMGGDFFVLPSSIHEVIIVPDRGNYTYQDLLQMVTEINATQVMPEERLTDNVYHYDAKERVFETGAQFAEKQVVRAAKMEHGSVLAELARNQKACENTPKPPKQDIKRGEACL